MSTPTAQVSGLASGIDWQQTVQMMMEIESQPQQLLEDRKSGYEEKLQAWQDIDAKLLSMKSTMDSMDTLSELLKKTATSSDTDVATATANSDAIAGSYTLEVNQLAQSTKLTSGGLADQSTTSVHNGPGDGTFEYTVGTGAEQTTYSVSVPPGTTLSELADLINQDVDNPGVTATTLNDGNAYHLVLTGETGADNVVALGAGYDLDVLVSGDYTETQTAQDAQLRVDGYPSGSWITSDSNEISDVISGVTINLKTTNAGSPITITISNDYDAVKDTIQSFVDAYNEAISQINLETKYDSDTEESGPLFGNASAIGIKSNLQSIVASTIPGIADNALYRSLAEVGVKIDSSGLMSIDDDKLTDAMETNFTSVGKVFAFSSTSTNNNLTYFYRTEATAGGTYSVVANYDATGTLTSATINGNTATIEGDYIIGADGQPEEGLRIAFTYPGGGAGSVSADVTLSTGAAVQISNKIDFITDPIDGTVQNAEDGINDAIDNLDQQIERWDERLATIEQQLTNEFISMELMVNQLQSTGNYLSSMMSNL